MFDGEKAVKQFESHCRYREEIEGHNHLAVISQECEPALGWISPPFNTSKIPSHGPFRDLEAELQKLAVDFTSALVQILFRHAANQGSNLDGDLRPSSGTRAPAPVEPESRSVPAHHGLRPYYHEGASAHADQRRRRIVQNRRSKGLIKLGRGCFRLNTASC